MVENKLQDICLDIEQRYEIKFVGIGTDKDHVHFLVQTVLRYSVTKLVTIIKSLTAREIFKRCPHVKKNYGPVNIGAMAILQGRHGNEDTVRSYVHNQGQEDYEFSHRDDQLELF